MPEYEVTVRQFIKIGQRPIAEAVERTFKVSALTRNSAIKSVRNLGLGHNAQVVAVTKLAPTMPIPSKSGLQRRKKL